MSTSSELTLCEKAQKFGKDNFLPLGFGTAIIIALSCPLPGTYLGSIKSGNFRLVALLNNIIVFFVSGLTLKAEEMGDVFKNRYAVIFGIFSINFLTTLLAFIMIRLPFPTENFAVGLTIFSTIPTTLGEIL